MVSNVEDGLDGRGPDCIWIGWRFVSAQEVELAESLSLNRATSMAISNSPQIKQVQWDIENAKGQQLQQSRLVNPTVGTIANEIGNEGQAGQYGVFIQRNIVRNNRVSQIQNAYQWRIKSLESSSEVTQRSIAQDNWQPVY